MNTFLWLLDFLNKFFRGFGVLVYNNTIIFLRLIVYYLISANLGLRPSFAIYQTLIYDLPSRDNCEVLHICIIDIYGNLFLPYDN